MGFHVVADEDTVVGFRYAGVPGTIVRSAAEARRELDRLASGDEKTIIVTTEQIANQVRDHVNRIRTEEEFPLIVEIPGPEGPSEQSPSLLSLIHEAVGIRF